MTTKKEWDTRCIHCGKRFMWDDAPWDNVTQEDREDGVVWEDDMFKKCPKCGAGELDLFSRYSPR